MTLGTATVGANGVATATITPAVGTYTVVANYTGTASQPNPNGTANSVSASQTLTVGKAAATVAVSSITALAPGGGSVTFTARVSATSGTPTGTVNFLNGTTILGSGTLNAGVATLTSTTLLSGTYAVSASYLGDTSFTAATSTTSAAVVIRTPAATTLTLTSSALTAPVKTTITLTATLATQATGTPSGSVTFYSGTTVLGTAALTNNVATFSGTLPAGTSTLTVIYSGDTLFLTSTSNALTEAITNPTLSISATPNPLIIQRGHSGILTLTLTPSGGFAGTVTLACGSLPQYVTCLFAPNSLVFTAASSAAQTDMLTIYTNTQLTASLNKPGTLNPASLAMLLWLPSGALALFGLRRKGTQQRFKSLLMVPLVVAGLGMAGSLSGCASNNSFNTATPGTFTVPLTLNATDGSTQTINATVTIQ